jgi:poly(3-hydroxybutyrate) depolymerase
MKVSPLARATALAASITLATPEIAARCLVTPGPDGELSTWLVAGPYRTGPLTPRPSWNAVLEGLLTQPARGLGVGDSALHASATGANPSWRAAVSNRASLDVGAILGGRGGRVAYAGVVLDVESEGARYLLLGTDDAVSVRLDDREVFHRATPRPSHEDLDAIRLDLTRGRHTLTLKLASRGDMDLFARLVNTSFRPDPAVRVELADLDDAGCASLTGRAAAITLTRHVVAEGTRLDAEVAFPGGVAHTSAITGVDVDVTVRPQGAASRNSRATVTLTEGGALRELLARDAVGDVTFAIGATAQTFSVRVAPAVRAALLRSREVLTPLDGAFMREVSLTAPPSPRATEALPAGSIWSVERVAERLDSLVAEGDPDATHLGAEAALLGALLDDVAAGRDPYARRTGALRRAYRSPLDGTLQEYSVYVPSAYRGDRAMPLVMGLHGLHGTAHRMLPILTGLYDEDEPRTHADRYLPPMPEVGALLVAPYGFGDAAYRQQGEHDVLRVLDEVRRAYRVDADRTYMTGLSMGGIGAAWVPFHHPDVFAATAALCGYHSYFVRNDTRGVRRPWETFLMELRSNVSYAENGLHLPLYVVQGTLDRPITNSTVLTERYTALGYTLESEFPRLDHNVWSTTYANGRIVPHFLRYRRESHPRTLRFRTPELRWNTAWWLTVDALADGDAAPQRTGRWGEVNLDTARDATGTGTTSGVRALTLTPPREAYAPGARALRLTLDGDRVELPLGAPTSLVRGGGHWRVGARPSARAGGPVRELFDTPMIFVVGTADPAETRVNERVAERWARRSSVRARYPIVRDDAFTDAMGEGRTLVLIGRSNRVLARMAARLPLRVDERAVTLGERRFEGDDAGAVFAAPNPDDPARAVLVIAGTTPLGTLLSCALPDLVPEYVVYDARVAPARGRVILGAEAAVRAAGFFDFEGRPVGSDVDPIAPRP